MKICVAGLGLIGGSMCMSLKRAGYFVGGYNRSEEPITYALANGIIDERVTNFCHYDVVFVALPPKATINFILNTTFKEGAIVSDICGVKGIIEDALSSKELNIKYIGTHPMAGKEVSGIHNACADLFDRASMVLTHGKLTDSNAYETIKKLIVDMGFKRLVECSSKVHDQKIAYTSQLAHVVSNCYVKDETVESCLGFTGGSFQDMTRIAGVDENMWAELYLANADNLSGNIGKLIANLTDIKRAIDGGNKAELVKLLKEGREQYTGSKANSFTKYSGDFENGQITTTLLHD
jgi:prephenate dehydrogenase